METAGRVTPMQLGLIGLGRMGANMATRLLDAGHDIVVYDSIPPPPSSSPSAAPPRPPLRPTW